MESRHARKRSALHFFSSGVCFPWRRLSRRAGRATLDGETGSGNPSGGVSLRSERLHLYGNVRLSGETGSGNPIGGALLRLELLQINDVVQSKNFGPAEFSWGMWTCTANEPLDSKPRNSGQFAEDSIFGCQW